MEFSLFAHMERITDDQPYDLLYEQFIDLCQMADDGGMRAIWTGEHHGMEFTIAANPLMTLVDVAHHTKNLRLGTGTGIAPFWHPIKLAGEAAAGENGRRRRHRRGREGGRRGSEWAEWTASQGEDSACEGEEVARVWSCCSLRTWRPTSWPWVESILKRALRPRWIRRRRRQSQRKARRSRPDGS